MKQKQGIVMKTPHRVISVRVSESTFRWIRELGIFNSRTEAHPNAITPADLLSDLAIAFADACGRAPESVEAGAALRLLELKGYREKIIGTPLEILRGHDAFAARARAKWWQDATPEQKADALCLEGRDRVSFLEQCRKLGQPPERLAIAEGLWTLILRSRCVLHETDALGRRRSRAEWRGNAEELEALLKGDLSALSAREKAKVPKANWIGRRLRECARCFGESVCQPSHTRLNKEWVLRPLNDVGSAYSLPGLMSDSEIAASACST